MLVDSSVWIDYLRSTNTAAALKLDTVLGIDQVLVGDLVLTEVLQGIDGDRHYRRVRSLMLDYGAVVEIGGQDVAIRAAEYYRFLRARGITVRKTIDTLIATRCILDNIPLLYSDRDFDPFVEHLGLQSALALS